MKTWAEIVGLASSYMAEKGVPDAGVAAELLMARLLSCGRGFLSSRMGEEPPERMVEAMRRGVQRLLRGEPVQYVLGEWDFRKLTLKCDRRALIPRPETEELVTRALAHLKALPEGAEPLVVDVGTGSGCIILSLAKEYAGKGRFLGVDISPKAVALAAENAEKCGLKGRVEFAVADGLDEFGGTGAVDVLVSNPPYIATEECGRLDPRIRDWEPRNALDGGATGLDFYERLVGDAINVLKPGGAVFFEIGDTQGEAVKGLLFEAGFDDIRIEKDYAGLDRYASAVLPADVDDVPGGAEG